VDFSVTFKNMAKADCSVHYILWTKSHGMGPQNVSKDGSSTHRGFVTCHFRGLLAHAATSSALLCHSGLITAGQG
jgi:hypothetical protein